MSRRSLSFSNIGASSSPLKQNTKISIIHSPRYYDSRAVTGTPSSPFTYPFISSLQLKLKEKYSSVSCALKKISELYPAEIPFSGFKTLLKNLKVKFSEQELKDFFSQANPKKKSSISLEILARHLNPTIQKSQTSKSFKKLPLIRSQNNSTRSSSKALEETYQNLSLLIPSQNKEETPTQNPLNVDQFLNSLIELLKSPESVTDYFYISRGEELSQPDFELSLKSLGLLSYFPDAFNLFQLLSERKEVICIRDFYDKLFNLHCKQLDEHSKIINEFRTRLRGYFSNHVRAFQDISAEGLVNLPVLENVSKKIGLHLTKDQLADLFSRYEPSCKLKFKEFKLFWLGKEGICAVNECEETILENYSYCKDHFQCLANRGEEIYTKLQIIMKTSQLADLIYRILKEDKKKGYLVNGFELQKKDVQGLREFLKINGFTKINKKRTNNSVISRCANK